MPYLGAVLLVLWIFCIVDALLADESRVRTLPKVAWVFIVILLPDIGSILWLVFGRPRNHAGRNRMIPPTPGYPEYERLGRATGSTADSDEEFLRKCRERAEEQRRLAEERRRAEQEGT